MNELKEDWDDKRFVQSKLREDSMNLQYASGRLRDDEDIVKYVVQNEGFQFASERLRGSKSFLLGRTLEQWNHGFFSIKYLSDQLKDDEDVIIESFRLHNEKNDEFQYVSDRLKNDPRFIAKIMHFTREKKFAWEHAMEHFGNNPMVVSAMVSEKDCLEQMSDEMKSNRSVVLASVNKFPLSLQFASNELRDDEEIVLCAIKGNAQAFKFASERIKNSKEFLIRGLNIQPWLMEFATYEIKNDKKIAIPVLKQNPYVFEKLGEELKHDKEFIVEIIESDSIYFSWLFYKLPEEIRDDEEIMFRAFKQKKVNSYHFDGLSERLKTKESFVLELAKIDIDVLEYVRKDRNACKILNNSDFAIKLIQIKPNAIEYIPKEMKENENFKELFEEFENSYTNASEAAAKWWTEHLGTLKQNNGDSLQSMFLSILSKKSEPKGNKANEFYEELKKELVRKFQNGETSVTLSTDYHPEGLLGIVAHRCDIETSAFPCKTVMWVEATQVSVRFGYGASEEIIFEAKNNNVDEELSI